MPMYKKSLLLLLGMAVLIAGIAAYHYESKDTNDTAAIQTETQTTPEASAEKNKNLVVYVVGAVNKPGVVNVSEGARVRDAVTACGGLLPTADESKINMAQVLNDGEQIRIPERMQIETNLINTTPKSNTNDANTSTRHNKTSKKKDSGQSTPININTADEKTLDEIPGVGPATAKRIIEYRESEGKFQSIEDIKNVRGIGNAKFEKMKDRICV